MKIAKRGVFRKIGELLDGFFRYNIQSKFFPLSPRSLMINLTYKCNSRCVMCNIWKIRPKNEITYEKWQELMKDNIFSDIRNLTISGGEPVLYTDYVKSVKLFVDSMPKLRRLVLNTNGFLPKIIEESIREIAKYCVKRKIKVAVSVSVDGVGSVHDKLRRIPEGFKKATETINRLKKICNEFDISVGVSTVIMRQNVKSYWEMKKWLQKNEINGGFQIVGFHKDFLKNKSQEKKIGINSMVKNDFLEVLGDVRNSRNKFSLIRYYWDDMIQMYGESSYRSTPCPFLKDDFVIDSLGDVYYCLSVRPIGNFLKEKRSVGKIYFDKKNILFRKNLPRRDCQNCNSGCNVTNGIAFEAKRYIWYKLTGSLWPIKSI
ncbi:MAG TPA: radical SAM protein [Candidatus Methanoperedens sp.]|nr:radical SAM protein [Candidatus Methanoperedens sp.]